MVKEHLRELIYDEKLKIKFRIYEITNDSFFEKISQYISSKYVEHENRPEDIADYKSMYDNMTIK